MSEYWKDRMATAQDKVSKKKQKQIEKQMQKYYIAATRNVIDEFEATYNKLLATMEEGKQPTTADLYKLDKYWNLQGQLKRELDKLGNKQIALLNKQFKLQFFDVYHSIALEGMNAFNTLDDAIVQQMINQIWCADGLAWSQRVWNNTNMLAETLNEELIHCVATGKKPSQLKQLLQERFNVSYSNADMLVRTELAHIQTQAAQKRYEDYGISEVEIWADEDERRCEVCGKLHKTKYPVGAHVPIPAHPRCRCCIVPVVD